MTDDLYQEKDPPEKFLDDREGWTADECLHFARTGQKPLNPEWVKYRRDVLAEAGIDEGDDSTDDEASMEAKSADELYELTKRDW